MRAFPTVPNGVARRGTYVLTDQGAITDSGAITAYRPAQHSKPPGMLKRINRVVESMRGRVLQPDVTTQQGSAAASPTTYYQTLWPQRFEKAQYIEDCYDQWFNDPACRKACNMFVMEAVRGGVRILVQGQDSMSRDAQDIADSYVKLWPTAGGPLDGISLQGGGLCAMIAGEFWPQAAIAGNPLRQDGYIDHFLNLPAVGMERKTDDADQFIDMANAYGQVDTQTWQDIATFPFWSVFNARWNWMPGSKNGNPEILSVRRLRRLLELMEAAKVTQVQVRAPMRYLWTFGDKDNTASRSELMDLMALNGFVEGKREIFDPTEVARDFFSNGIGKVEAVQGDSGIGECDHLKYFLDRVAVGWPTPRALMNLGAENINRDVLKDMTRQWLKQTQTLNEFLDLPILHFFEIQLALQGIDYKTLKYDTVWTTSSAEDPLDQVQTLTLLYDAGAMSEKTFVSKCQQFTGVTDIDAEIAEIHKDAELATKQELAKQQAAAKFNTNATNSGIGGSQAATKMKGILNGKGSTN